MRYASLLYALALACRSAAFAGMSPGVSRAEAAWLRIEVSDATTGAAIGRAVVTTSDGAARTTGPDGAVVIGPVRAAQPYRTLNVTVRAAGCDPAVWRGICVYPANTTIVPFRMTHTGRTQVTDEPRHGLETPSLREPGPPLPDGPGVGSMASLGPEPLTIRVWRKAKSTAAGYNIVEKILFEDYVKGVVPAEWYSSWNAESLKAGCVAARSYGWYCVLHPRYASIGADVSDDAYTQVYKDTRVASTNSAADASRAQVLTYNGSIISAEYSAENSDPTTSGGVPYQPSVSDPVCTGQILYGHGRGLCQWGSQRWAIGAPGSGGAKTYDWILNHYYSTNALLQTAGGGLDVGDCAAVEGGTAQVKDSPSGSVMANAASGTLVHILAGPTAYGGQSWWQVEWPMPAPTRSDGWMTGQMLVETVCPARAVAIMGISATGISEVAATIHWTTDTAASTVVHYGASAGSLTSTASGSIGTDHSVTLTGLTPSTTYYYTVESAAPGYVTTVSPVQSFQTAASMQPLVISALAVQTLAETTASVFWQTDHPSDTTANYGLSENALTQTATGLTDTVFHSAILTGLTPDTTYTVQAVSTASGYLPGSQMITLHTLQTLRLSNIAATGLETDHATISWTLNTPAAVQISYGTVSGAPDSGDSAPSGVTTLDLWGLQPNTTYFYRLTASETGHADVSSPEASFSTTPLGAVKVSGVAVTGVTHTGAVISWTPSPAGPGTVNYGPTAGPPYASSASDAAVVSHTVTLTGLTPGADVHYSVESTAAGYTTASTPDAVFTTVSLSGDVDGDGTVTLADTALAMRIANGEAMPDARALPLADLAVPPDGHIDVADCVVILRVATGLLTLP